MQTTETFIVEIPDVLDDKFDISVAENKETIINNSLKMANAYFELIKVNFANIDTSLDDKDYIGYSLMGLACEIYLKHLIYKNTNVTSYVSEHKLLSLVNLLDSGDRQLIIDTLSLQCSINKGDVEIEIEKISKTFIAFRYAYELNGFTLNIKLLHSLLDILNNLCK